MFKTNETSMNRANLRRRIRELSKIYEEPISYVSSATDDERGYVGIE